MNLYLSARLEPQPTQSTINAIPVELAQQNNTRHTLAALEPKWLRTGPWFVTR